MGKNNGNDGDFLKFCDYIIKNIDLDCSCTGDMFIEYKRGEGQESCYILNDNPHIFLIEKNDK
jgi:hypothetical protein